MKKFVALLVCSLIMIGGLAATATAAIEVEGAAYTQVEDTYLWRGFNLNADAQTDYLVEAGIDIYAGNFAFGLWSIRDDFAKTVVETDFWFDYTFAPTEKLSLTLGNIYYGTQDPAYVTNEAYLVVAYDTILAPTLSINYDWDKANETGLYYVLGAGHTFEIAENLGLNLGAELSYNQKSDFLIGDYNEFHNYELNASIDWTVVEQVVVSPMVRHSDHLSDEAELAGVEEETVASLAVTLEF